MAKFLEKSITAQVSAKNAQVRV